MSTATADINNNENNAGQFRIKEMAIYSVCIVYQGWETGGPQSASRPSSLFIRPELLSFDISIVKKCKLYFRKVINNKVYIQLRYVLVHHMHKIY